MDNKLIRSGAPHTVTFSEVTHNAIRPKNDLTAGEKKELITQSPTEKIEVESPLADDHYHEAIQRLEDQVMRLKKKHYSDNRQKIGDDALTDNIQSVNESDRIEDNIVYLGKENIKDRFVSINSSTADSSSNLLIDEQISYKESSSVDAMNIEPHSDFNTLQVDDIQTQSELEQLLPEVILDAQDSASSMTESQLQAQIRLMKQKLLKANRELIEIQDEIQNRDQDN